MKRLLALLLFSALLSGCLTDDDDVGGDDGGTSGSTDGGDDGMEDVCGEATEEVELLSADYQAVPTEPFETTVDVPACAMSVKYEISTAAAGNPKAATLDLAGCGSDTNDFGGPASTQVGLNTVASGDLCDEATEGTQDFSITANSAPMGGSITLTAMVPPS